MRGKLCKALPWLYWMWCYAHRLELACKDACTSQLCKDLQEMLLRLYYLYSKSPKKSRELCDIVEDLKEVWELSAGGNIPVRSQGSRWICHKRKALQRVIDRYRGHTLIICLPLLKITQSIQVIGHALEATSRSGSKLRCLLEQLCMLMC